MAFSGVFIQFQHQWNSIPSEKKRIMKTLFLLFTTAASIFITNTLDSFQFSSKSISLAEKASTDSGKLIFIYYTAEGCLPCQLLEKSISSDSYLVDKMNEKYITVAIDGDEIESTKILEKHNICCVPAFQIINSLSKVISMSEDALTKNELYNFLDISNNEIAVAAPESTNAVNQQGVKSTSTFQSGRIEVKENTYAEMKAKSVQYGVVNTNEVVSKTEADETTQAKSIGLNEKDKVADSYPKINEKVAEDMIGILTEVKEKSIQTNEHAEPEMTIAKSPSEKESVQKVYASEEVSKKTIKREKVKKIKPATQGKLEYLQAGAFSNALNADKLKTKLAQNTKDVLVIESTGTGSDSQKLYKVLIGPIRSSEDRRLIINTLSKYGIVGFSVVI